MTRLPARSGPPAASRPSSRSPLAPLALALLLGACRPEFDRGPSLVEGPRVLALSSTPAEARPGEPVTYAALLVDPSGTRTDVRSEWAFCNERKPLTELGPVAPACLAPSGPALTPLGTGPVAAGALPAEGCRVFGPDPPLPKAGEPAGRPVDPDPSGGYYQPLRLLYGVDGGNERYALGGTRLLCGLSGANQATAADFGRRYRRNENPALASVRVFTSDGNAVELAPEGSAVELAPDGNAVELAPEGAATPPRIAPGASVRFVATWPACPASDVCGDGVCGLDETPAECAADCSAPVGCRGAERYLAFDPSTRALSERLETLRVAWFSPAGRFDDDATGAGPENESPNGWRAPDAPGIVPLWVVVRDDRGGVGFASYRVEVGGAP